MTVEYIRFIDSDGLRYLAELAQVYDKVYREPPYEEGPEQTENFREGFAKEVEKDGFSLIVATSNLKAIGFSYGWTMPAKSWWSRADQEAPPAVFENEKFAVMEWVVVPERRSEGIGSRLIRLLLSGRRETLATLASDPRSTARGMYERSGWKKTGSAKLSWGPAMDLLVLNLD